MRKPLAAVLAVVVVLMACSSDSKPATVGSTFDNPPAFPGPTWTRDGKAAPTEVIAAAAGPEHCGWQSATLLTVGWPIGTAATSAAQARQYVRDPEAVLGRSDLHDGLDLHAALPADAASTGYMVNGITLYLAPSDQDAAAYLVAGSTTERWPRSDPMTVCS